MTSVEAYIQHGRKFGGLDLVWDTASTELAAADLGRLAVGLRAIEPRRRGGDGRITEPRFALSRTETARLVRRLDEAGVPDSEIRRYAGISQSLLGKVRQVSDRPISPDLNPAHQGVIRNGNHSAADTSNPPRSACAWCSEPLPSTVRAGANYCVGGACKQAAYRARQKTSA